MYSAVVIPIPTSSMGDPFACAALCVSSELLLGFLYNKLLLVFQYLSNLLRFNEYDLLLLSTDQPIE